MSASEEQQQRNNAWTLPCHFQTLSLMNCKSRAEAFAKSLHSKLKSLGRRDGNEEEDDDEDEGGKVGNSGATAVPAGEKTRLMAAAAAHQHHGSPADAFLSQHGEDELYFDFGILSSPESPADVDEENPSRPKNRAKNSENFNKNRLAFHDAALVVNQPIGFGTSNSNPASISDLERRRAPAACCCVTSASAMERCACGCSACEFELARSNLEFTNSGLAMERVDQDEESGCMSAVSSVLTEQDNDCSSDGGEAEDDDVYFGCQYYEDDPQPWSPCSPVAGKLGTIAEAESDESACCDTEDDLGQGRRHDDADGRGSSSERNHHAESRGRQSAFGSSESSEIDPGSVAEVWKSALTASLKMPESSNLDLGAHAEICESSGISTQNLSLPESSEFESGSRIEVCESSGISTLKIPESSNFDLGAHAEVQESSRVSALNLPKSAEFDLGTRAEVCESLPVSAVNLTQSDLEHYAQSIVREPSPISTLNLLESSEFDPGSITWVCSPISTANLTQSPDLEHYAVSEVCQSSGITSLNLPESPNQQRDASDEASHRESAAGVGCQVSAYQPPSTPDLDPITAEGEEFSHDRMVCTTLQLDSVPEAEIEDAACPVCISPSKSSSADLTESSPSHEQCAKNICELSLDPRESSCAHNAESKTGISLQESPCEQLSKSREGESLLESSGCECAPSYVDSESPPRSSPDPQASPNGNVAENHSCVYPLNLQDLRAEEPACHVYVFPAPHTLNLLRESPCESHLTVDVSLSLTIGDEEASLSPVPEDDFPQRVRRSSSLKTCKTPPGTPNRKKIVRFADAMGLDLEAVKTVFLDDLPTVPSSAFVDLQDAGPDETPCLGGPQGLETYAGALDFRLPKPARNLVPTFPQPASLADFVERLRRQVVCLESAVLAGDTSVRLVVRVLNLDFDKYVAVRYSADGWATVHCAVAEYVPSSHDGFSDKFATVVSADDVQAGDRLAFAVQYVTQGREYWDNNYGQNYCFQCFLEQQYQPSPTDDSWVHFL